MSEQYSEVSQANLVVKEISLPQDLQIKLFHHFEESKLRELVTKNMALFEDSQTILSAMYRRLTALSDVYSEPGCCLFVACKENEPNEPIGLVGLGPLHGLDFSEKIGEIRDLVVVGQMRGKGIGKELLRNCIEQARALGYRRLYLETSPTMTVAQKLFLRSGFKPVKEKTNNKKDLASYFIMENL